jgi:ADP-heptose:LPS heptosyltransferase
MAVGPSVNTFLQRTSAARKIIVVDFGFLGDSVHLVPSLWEIKRHYPAAELHTLSATVGAEVLKLAPCVNRAWAFPLTPDSPSWWRHWDVLKQLRRERFDVAFNFSGADRTVFSTAFLGPRWTLAREGGRKHFWHRLLNVDWVKKADADLPMFEQRRQVLAAAGFTLAPAKFELKIPDEARAWAEAEVKGQPVHLSINASSAVKEWPLENWIEFVKLFSEKFPEIPLCATASGSPREQKRLRDLIVAAKSAKIQSYEGLNISRLAALVQRCRLQIGADSGVLHLAMALNVPTTTVFREYGALAEWIPLDGEHRNIIAPCPCISEGKNDCALAGRSACLGSISAAAVLEKACQLIH